MPLIVIGLSHHSSPVTVRERFAFAEAAIPAALQKLRATGLAREAVILSTCNRVEIYAATDLPERQAAAELRQIPARLPPLPGTARRGNLLPAPTRQHSSTSSKSPAAWTRWCWAKPKSSAS